MSSSVEGVGGVEHETVTLWRWTRRDGHGWMRHRLDLPGPWESQEFVPLSALRLVEEELRQALEVAHSRLRDRARLVRRAERAEADLDLLIRRFALVSARSGVRAQALQLAEECITENVANGEGVDSQPAVLDAIFDALKYEIADEPDGARPGAEPPIQSTPVSPVQGEHEQGELDAAREALRYIADHALDVDCDGECAGVLVGMAQHFEDKFPPSRWQGEHEQDGEDALYAEGCEAMDRTASGGQGVRNDDSEATR